MDVVAGKNGSFFVVRRKIGNTVINMLSDVSYDEYGRYHAYSTLKKISKDSCADYARKNGLHAGILENFSFIEDVVDFRATQDVMYFVESDDGRERNDGLLYDIVIDKSNYKNGFAHAAPREVSGLVTDSFSMPEKEVPLLLKNVGISIVRELLSNFVRWNDITYRVDIVPSRKLPYRTSFDGRNLKIVEECYVFQSDDWNIIKKIEQKFVKEKARRQSSWFLGKKEDAELLQDILSATFKDKKMLRKYTDLCEAYRAVRRIRHDYIGAFITEFHGIRNRILLENYRLQPTSKALSAQNMYYILIENERSAAMAATIERLNTYWQNHSWRNLLALEPCFAVLSDRDEQMRDKLLCNMEFVLNVKLQYWNEHDFAEAMKKITFALPRLEAQNSLAKGEDTDNSCYLRQRSMLYSFYIYNPNRKKYELKCLDKFIKVDVPITLEAQQNIIDKAQYYIDRKKTDKQFLLMKEGISLSLLRKAAVIYDAYRRLRAVSKYH